MKDITTKPKWYACESNEAVYLSTNSKDLVNPVLFDRFPDGQKNKVIYSQSAPSAGLYLPAHGQLQQVLDTGSYNFSPIIHQAVSEASKGCFLLNPQNKNVIKAPQNENRIGIIGLGNVGSTLLQGLVLIDPAASRVSEIMVIDTNEALVKRWEMEANQINSPHSHHPKVLIGNADQLKAVDLILFCVTSGVPHLGEEKNQDVRLTQFDGNAAILRSYLDQLIEADYQGVFAVMSDPVDHLTRFAIEYTKGKMDSAQFVGLGHGVMFARAHYLAGHLDKNNLWATGTHGDLAFIINDICHFDEAESMRLTEETIHLNIKVRELGFLPYAAPGLSSGALSVVSLLNEKPFFGALWNGEMVWGSKMMRKNGLWGWMPIGQNERLRALLNSNRKKIDRQYRQLVGHFFK